jgi:hypothetical protein
LKESAPRPIRACFVACLAALAIVVGLLPPAASASTTWYCNEVTLPATWSCDGNNKIAFWSLPVVAVACVVGVLVGATPIGGAPPSAARFDGGVVSVLDRVRRADDKLPAPAQASSVAIDHIDDMTGARLAHSTATERVYVARGRENRICLVIVELVQDMTAVDCAGAGLLATGGLVVSVDNPDGTWTLVGVTDDAYRTARAHGRSTAIRNNVFVIRNSVAADSVTVESAAGSKEIDLGPHAPTGSVGG